MRHHGRPRSCASCWPHGLPGMVTPHRDAEPSQLQPPERLNPKHVVEDFDSGSPALDDWLRLRALRNETEGASRTYVVRQDTRVISYYCLADGAVLRTGAPSRVRREMADPIPVMVLGRLAVGPPVQGSRLGKALLRDAVLRTLQAADIAGIRAILVHAKDEAARSFYERSGFLPSPIDPLDPVAAAQGRSRRTRRTVMVGWWRGWQR
jgi:predicted N-acetyltransferase YhbS